MNRARVAIACLLLVGGMGGSAPLWAEPPVAVSDPAPRVQETPPSASRPGATPSRARPGKGIRTLDEITIEGEVAVPQVLFITARDRPRYEDRLHRRYLMGSLDLARITPLPEHFGIRFRTRWEETR